eukprot:g1808.t1
MESRELVAPANKKVDVDNEIAVANPMMGGQSADEPLEAGHPEAESDQPSRGRSCTQRCCISAAAISECIRLECEVPLTDHCVVETCCGPWPVFKGADEAYLVWSFFKLSLWNFTGLRLLFFLCKLETDGPPVTQILSRVLVINIVLFLVYYVLIIVVPIGVITYDYEHAFSYPSIMDEWSFVGFLSFFTLFSMGLAYSSDEFQRIRDTQNGKPKEEKPKEEKCYKKPVKVESKVEITSCLERCLERLKSCLRFLCLLLLLEVYIAACFVIPIHAMQTFFQPQMRLLPTVHGICPADFGNLSAPYSPSAEFTTYGCGNRQCPNGTYALMFDCAESGNQFDRDQCNDAKKNATEWAKNKQVPLKEDDVIVDPFEVTTDAQREAGITDERRYRHYVMKGSNPLLICVSERRSEQYANNPLLNIPNATNQTTFRSMNKLNFTRDYCHCDLPHEFWLLDHLHPAVAVIAVTIMAGMAARVIQATIKFTCAWRKLRKQIEGKEDSPWSPRRKRSVAHEGKTCPPCVYLLPGFGIYLFAVIMGFGLWFDGLFGKWTTMHKYERCNMEDLSKFLKYAAPLMLAVFLLVLDAVLFHFGLKILFEEEYDERAKKEYQSGKVLDAESLERWWDVRDRLKEEERTDSDMKQADSFFVLFLPIFAASTLIFYLNLYGTKNGGKGILFSWAFTMLTCGALFYFSALMHVFEYQRERGCHDNHLKKLLATGADDPAFSSLLKSKLLLLEVEDSSLPVFKAFKSVDDSNLKWAARLFALQPLIYVFEQIQSGSNCGI